MSDPDYIVIGAGPNGLTAACHLAGASASVLVLEAQRDRPGGLAATRQPGLPGFLHDSGASLLPFVPGSRAFRGLYLERHGLTFDRAPLACVQLGAEGSSLELSSEPGRRLRVHPVLEDAPPLAAWLEGWAPRFPAIAGAALSPRPLRDALAWLEPREVAQLAWDLSGSAVDLGKRLAPEAPALLPALALHAGVDPRARGSAALAGLLALGASSTGLALPRGGAQGLINALFIVLDGRGGKLRLDARVERILSRDRRALGVRLASGEEILAQRGVLLAAGAHSLVRLTQGELGAAELERDARQRNRRSALVVSWELLDAVPWRAEPAARAATVLVGGEVEPLLRHLRAVEEGRLPSHPCATVVQTSLVDEIRAPIGRAAITARVLVPAEVEGGWEARRDAFLDRLELSLEEQAPGFRKLILDRYPTTPDQLEGLSPGHAGPLGPAWSGGSLLPPRAPGYRTRPHRTGWSRLWLASSETPPGPGVHGMNGYCAARLALEQRR